MSIHVRYTAIMQQLPVNKMQRLVLKAKLESLAMDLAFKVKAKPSTKTTKERNVVYK